MATRLTIDARPASYPPLLSQPPLSFGYDLMSPKLKDVLPIAAAHSRKPTTFAA
jgi:hypothetical protein